MRTHPPENPTPSADAAAALVKLTMDKAEGVEMHSVSKVIDLASQTIRDIITTTLHGVQNGIAGEPTGEDLQRLHELRALLDDLPKGKT